MFSAFFRSLKQEFAGYNSKKLLADMMAGLTVCAVALPLALAFGVSSGASAASGLVTAIIAGVGDVDQIGEIQSLVGGVRAERGALLLLAVHSLVLPLRFHQLLECFLDDVLQRQCGYVNGSQRTLRLGTGVSQHQ